MAEMDIGFGPGKFNPDLNTQMGGVDPLLQKASRIKSPEEGIGVAVELAGEERRLGERETAAKIKKEKALPEIEAAYKAEEGRLVKEARTREQDVMAEAEQAMSQFTVSKETLGGMATLASVIGVLGSLAGNTGGKQAGLGAIKSMTGMMAGYQKGRADEFRRDQIEFDKQYKIMQGKLDRASKEFDRAIAMMPYNMAEAQKIKNTALAELNSDIITAVDAKQGITRANSILKQAVDVANQNLNRANQLKIAEMRSSGGTGGKIPKEMIQAHSLREKIVPQLEEALPILTRLQNEGKWDELSGLIGIDNRLAEYNFRDDPEAIRLIRTLALFRSSEFETAGKALTKVENKILAPLYQSGFRPYEAINNAINQSLGEMRKEQLRLERQYPNLRPQEANLPQSPEAAPAQAPQATVKPMPTGPKLKAYADENFDGNEQDAKDYLASQGYR
jgi:hypothetical protein